MKRIMLKSKIHRATVTGADIHYEGSITIDEELMGAARLVEYERLTSTISATGTGFPPMS